MLGASSHKAVIGLLAVIACAAAPDRAAAQFRANNTTGQFSMFPPGFQMHFSYNSLPGLPTQQGQLGGGFGGPPPGIGFNSPFGFGTPFGGNPLGFGFPPVVQAARMARQPMTYVAPLGYQQSINQQSLMNSSPGFSWFNPYDTSLGFSPMSTSGFGSGFPTLGGY